MNQLKSSEPQTYFYITDNECIILLCKRSYAVNKFGNDTADLLLRNGSTILEILIPLIAMILVLPGDNHALRSRSSWRV